ncbi:MAG: hypothetical protein EOO61_19505 [Hymenobacter sp.]|nr:MAG: hypothetical protein EOO61_19505 [Hymenobacter sp.]
MSFDDNDLFRLHSPTITAIAQPVEALAEAVINVLLEKLTTTRPAPQQLTLLPVLVVRGSSVRKSSGPG